MANIQTQPATGNLVQPLMINAHPQPSLQIARHAKTFKILGILQLVLGTGSIILGIVVIIVANIYLNWLPDMGSGIWCGVFFLVSGILSYLSSKKRDPCLVIAGMIMAILSAMAAAVLLFFQVIWTLSYLYLTLTSVLRSILCVMAFAELIIAITHSAYCCAASSCCCAASSCCCAETSRRQRVTETTGNSNSIPLAMPAQLSTSSYVTQPQFGATVMPINKVPIESYQGFTNQPIGAMQSNNMMTTALTNKDQPTQYRRA